MLIRILFVALLSLGTRVGRRNERLFVYSIEDLSAKSTDFDNRLRIDIIEGYLLD